MMLFVGLPQLILRQGAGEARSRSREREREVPKAKAKAKAGPRDGSTVSQKCWMRMENPRTLW